ncbi:Uncharacterised protein [Mycobacterium tuberculosis]|nr:Uncharacterised protein [Mycobacterium tuberculosis]SGK51215.1 Uncharacterised protein [Mycobacterium tuberculosis]SHA01019.1 Uncharacterised protein [Mycobacterium tuberculosis]
MADRRDRILPQQGLLGDQRPKVSRNGTHVSVDQLVPGLGELVGQFLGVFQPATRDPLIDRIHPQREVSGQHRRGAPWPAERVRDGAGTGAVLGGVLPSASRALRQLPLVAVQDLEETVVPFRRGVRPYDLDAVGDRVLTGSGAIRALPAQAHLLQRSSLGFGADQIGRAGAMGLTESVTADDQRRCFDVVHGHAPKRLANVDRRGHGVRVAVRPLRVHVDQPHLHRGQRVLQIPLTAVTLIAEPGGFLAPIDLIGLPLVDPAEAEPERLEAHRFQRAVAGENNQVRP